MPIAHRCIIVAGPCGVGKSTIGKALAKSLDVPFIEGDDFHPAVNVAKMQSGMPLKDEDRGPWLQRLHREVVLRRGTAVLPDTPLVVLTCSALKRAYRDLLRSDTCDGEVVMKPHVFFIFLDGDHEVLLKRLTDRAGHFMPPVLLPSQLTELEALQPDESGQVVDLNQTLEDVVKQAEGIVSSFLKVG